MSDTPAADTPEEVVDAVEHPHQPPTWAPLALVAFVGLVICTNVANGVWARWVHSDPAALLALSSRQRYLVLTVAGGISPLAYIVVATLRIAAAFVVCHLIGRAYHDQAIGWMTRYLGQTPEGIATFQRGFGRAEWALIPFFAGSNIVAVLSGTHRTAPARLAALLAVGIAGRLALVWWLAKVFEEPLLDVLDVVQRYQWWVIAVSIGLVVLVNVRNVRRGAG
ncbi:MAG: hypothetical protein ACK5OX_04345 [Desertimonas sp.]